MIRAAAASWPYQLVGVVPTDRYVSKPLFGLYGRRLASDRTRHRGRCKGAGIAVPRPVSVRNITGEGIVAVVEGQEVRVVSPGYLVRLGRTISDPRLRELEAQGKSVVVLVRGGEPRALFALADIVRPESREAVAQLKKLGISPIMLTGDAKGVAEAVSAELGIDEYIAEVLPDQKAARSSNCVTAACASP